jgi:hypothetical protein
MLNVEWHLPACEERQMADAGAPPRDAGNAFVLSFNTEHSTSNIQHSASKTGAR